MSILYRNVRFVLFLKTSSLSHMQKNDKTQQIRVFRDKEYLQILPHMVDL